MGMLVCFASGVVIGGALLALYGLYSTRREQSRSDRLYDPMPGFPDPTRVMYHERVRHDFSTKISTKNLEV